MSKPGSSTGSSPVGDGLPGPGVGLTDGGLVDVGTAGFAGVSVGVSPRGAGVVVGVAGSLVASREVGVTAIEPGPYGRGTALGDCLPDVLRTNPAAATATAPATITHRRHPALVRLPSSTLRLPRERCASIVDTKATKRSKLSESGRRIGTPLFGPGRRTSH
ncbi:hypothetical protein ACIBSW_40410 [Actinoplanes sp. NPDC049668]|uniref:hypothetical protein n=1 Tax=unclassified Actinoplanes TaxID=2626549 RepID=UPI0033B652B2